jgi:DNA-binding response OmpR family regulator
MARILLIEPDSVLTKTYKSALEQASHKVKTANGAQQAIDVTDDHTPDAIILEIQLPGHNGVEFLYELRSYPEWQTIPVIILSNVTPTDFGTNPNVWRELGIVSYYYKPRTTLAKLVDSVNQLIAQKA